MRLIVVFPPQLADHYGPAEVLFVRYPRPRTGGYSRRSQGEFREKWSDPQEIFGATKWCVFRTVDPTRALVEAAVDDRLARMHSRRVDLLQVSTMRVCIGVSSADLGHSDTGDSFIGRITAIQATSRHYII